MTLGELSKLQAIAYRIKDAESRLSELRAKRIGLQSPTYDGMPKSKSRESSVEHIAAVILDQEKAVADLVRKYYCERLRLERWIAAIPDSLTRQVFTARFVEGLPWAEVAEYIGGSISPSGAKKICYRYLDG